MSQAAAPAPHLKPRIFYGWYIVGLSFLTNLIASGINSYTLGVFMLPMQQDLGWSRTAISGVQVPGTLVNALLTPFIGSLLDRRGGKALMVGGALLFGAGLIVTSLVQQVWQLYLIRAALIGVGAVGMSDLVVTVAVSNWFVRKRGRALAFGSIGLSVAGVILPSSCTLLIVTYGWRVTWAILGLLTWALMIPAAALILRRRPEDMGLQPDGDPPNYLELPAEAARPPREGVLSRDVRWTRRQAMQTSALWLIIGATSLTLLANPAMLLHLVPFLEGVGFSAAEAAGGLTAIGLCGLLCKPLWGLLLERVPIRYSAMTQMLVSSSGIGAILFTGYTGRWWLVMLACFYFGIGIAGVGPVGATIWADYFGRFNLGAIRSIGIPFTAAASSGGALLGGLIYDRTGSYQVAFAIFMTALVVAACLIGISRAPIPPVPVKETSLDAV